MSPSPADPKKTINVNGPRPSPLMIAKESHSIQKQAVMRKPIIIYTHSPKVIHTKPQDFMSLVQRLTGMPRSDADNTTYSDESGLSSLVKEERGWEGSEITSRELGYGVAADMPLFTPNSDSPFGILGSLISPSALAFIKDLPEY